jgi:hypothetical protein
LLLASEAKCASFQTTQSAYKLWGLHSLQYGSNQMVATEHNWWEASPLENHFTETPQQFFHNQPKKGQKGYARDTRSSSGHHPLKQKRVHCWGSCRHL